MITKKQRKELERISQEIKDLKKYSRGTSEGKLLGDSEVIHLKYDRLMEEALVLLGGEVVIDALKSLEKEVDFCFWYS